MGSSTERQPDQSNQLQGASSDHGDVGQHAGAGQARNDAADAAARRMASPGNVKALIAGGLHDPNKLTDQLFWNHHPEAAGKKLERGSPLALEWVDIRDEVVRPALAEAAHKPPHVDAAKDPVAQKEAAAPVIAAPVHQSVPVQPAPIQANPTQVAPSAVVHEGDVTDWTTVLPQSGRDAKHAIHEKKGGNGIDVPKLDVPALTEAQQTVFSQLKARRAELPALMSEKKNRGAEGYSYHDARPGDEKVTPTPLKDAPKSRANDVKKLIWDELGTEGGLDGINTYDNQIVTWGKGFSAGDWKAVMHSMFKEDPEAEKLLLSAGIALKGNEWWVVDNDTGLIEKNNNALRLLQYDNKLLSVFITIGHDPKHQQAAANAQWEYMDKKSGNVPAYALNWPDDTIRLGAHLSHWMEHYGWEYISYADTGGDIYKYIVKYTQILSKDYGTKHPSGAIVQKAYNLYDNPGHRLHAFAYGAGARALKSQGKQVKLTDEQLKSDKALDGHLYIPIDHKGNYFDLG